MPSAVSTRPPISLVTIPPVIATHFTTLKPDQRLCAIPDYRAFLIIHWAQKRFDRNTHLIGINKDTKILVADDHESMHTIVKQALNHVGFPNVKVADDGPTAMPMLKNGSFDLWVFDWNMAQRQDIDLLKAVRTDSSL